MTTATKCAIFASGGGSNFQSLIDHRDAGDLHADLSVLIGNNSNAYAFERAKKYGIRYVHIAPSHFTEESAYAQQLLSVLQDHHISLIILAGYMKKIPSLIIKNYPYRIVNIHPALLPAFGGRGLFGEKVHQAVLDYGAKISGITIHFVDEEYDHGPIIFQTAIDVLDTDTAPSLAKRVLTLEHTYFWKVVDAVACGKISVQGRKVYGTI